MPTPKEVRKFIKKAGGKVEEIGEPLPDGSGFAIASFPLPKDHWLYQDDEDDGFEPPPIVLRIGTDDPNRAYWEAKIKAAGRYAVRTATLRGKQMDFDPDALIQNLVISFLGYCTPDALK